MLAKTYTITQNAPPPMSSEDYHSWIDLHWKNLLMSDPTEPAVQEFLERHPVLVPGAFGAKGLSSGHSPFPSALISQPRLYGYQGRIPDFLWLSINSNQLSPVFIEIERPSKKIFLQSDGLTQPFNQACYQITQWRQWLAVPNHLDSFFNDYGLNDFRHLAFKPHFVLIYGRRSEFEGDPERAKMVGHLLSAPDETLMSYDRLGFEPKADQLVSVRHTNKGYQVRHLPPTYWLGPMMFHHKPRLLGRAAAVDRNPLISPARKAFMKQRIPYWETWNKRPSGIQSTGDRE